jgi:hypothetical protein
MRPNTSNVNEIEKLYIVCLKSMPAALLLLLLLSVTVAERSKACTVFARSEAGILGSNPT